MTTTPSGNYNEKIWPTPSFLHLTLAERERVEGPSPRLALLPHLGPGSWTLAKPDKKLAVGKIKRAIDKISSKW